MYYIIYKTTNKINKKYYIGKHETKDLNDGYLGSGTSLKSAIEKYGKENFSREILQKCKCTESLNQAEKSYITEEIIRDPMSYNINIGGDGGFYHINSNKEFYTQKIKQTMENKSPEEIAKINQKKKRVGKKNGMFGSSRTKENNPMWGRTHTKESKKIMSEKKKGKKLSKSQCKDISERTKKRFENPEERKKQGERLKKVYEDNPDLRKSQSEKMKGMLWFNNGKINKRFRKSPGSEWSRGRIKNV